MPGNQTIVLQGEDVILPCTVTGIPKPSISWRFDGGIRPPSTQDENGSLTVYSVRNNQTYEGLYTCQASNIAGTLTSNVTLIVDGKSFFLLLDLFHSRILENVVPRASPLLEPWEQDWISQYFSHNHRRTSRGSGCCCCCWRDFQKS